MPVGMVRKLKDVHLGAPREREKGRLVEPQTGGCHLCAVEQILLEGTSRHV